MDSFQIQLWGMSASATGDLAIIAMTLVALTYLALRFFGQLLRRG